MTTSFKRWVGDLSIPWKVLPGPLALVFAFAAFAGWTAVMIRTDDARRDAQAEQAAFQQAAIDDFRNLLSGVHGRLYRLTATAANESDTAKISAAAGAIT